jgi:predicted RNase H-like HicB family nuclease
MSFFDAQSVSTPEEPKVEMIFTVRVHDASDDGEDETGYWGEVLELDGCVSQGETLDELTENIREAILAWMAAHLEEEGHHPPKPTITMTVPVLIPV